MSRSRAQIAQRISKASGALATAALSRMEAEMPWFAQVPAKERSWIGLIVQAGIRSFVEWYRDPGDAPTIRAEVFGVAPRAMAGAISLEQTVAMVRVTLVVVDEHLDDLLGSDAPDARDAVNRYGREMAFATAEVYARAAEERGAWDARLEALAVDSLLRGDDGEATLARAAALGWSGTGGVIALAGMLGDGGELGDVRRVAREHKLDCLCAVQGERLLVVLGGVDPQGAPAVSVAAAFADGPVVLGPVVGGLGQAGESARAAQSGFRVVGGWEDAPRPVAADDLLPERALSGDASAIETLIRQVQEPLEAAGGAVLETVERYLACGSSLEATARALYVHPNTVRYRLRRAADLTALTPADPRDPYTLRVALTVGRLRRGPL